MKPVTRYTKSGDVNIAYQVFGAGPVDMVYIPGWVSNIDSMWSCPELVSFLQQLGKMARVILFDKRGTGLSDRILDFPTLEERMDDIRVVMDAVGSEKAVLFGHSEGGSVSALFAATYPNRTISLIAFGIFAKRVYAPDYPWAPTHQERQEVYDMIENNWGSGDMNLASLAPSKADDKVFMDWLASYFRAGASPRAAMVLTKMNTQVDIINILDAINVPTLILQRTNDVDVKIEEGRFIADRIPDAKFVEIEGDDHLFWAGNTDEVLKEMKAFVVQEKPALVYDKQLFTIVAGHLMPSYTDNLVYKELIQEYVAQYRGTMITCNAQKFIATFNGPTKALQCSMDLVEKIKKYGLALCMGIHIKECTVGETLYKDTEDLDRLVAKQSTPDQIVLTQTVKNLLVGMHIDFSPCRTIFETETGESLVLYSVDKKEQSTEGSYALYKTEHPQYRMLLEKVLKNIDSHLSNEQYGVEMMCREIGVSERQLQRKLKAITNKSPNKLISSVRLHRAKELILSKQDTIAEIAFQMGFSNPSYFSKCFKKEFAISPSDLM